MPPPLVMLENDQPFRFSCSPRVPCFNACCRDLNQILTPYDILCLKHHLQMTAADFLAAYTEANIGPGSGLPVVSLRFKDSDDLACPFVSAAGCRVYPARPASCRTYPLARGVYRDRETGVVTERWALIKEPHCRGFANGGRQTVAEWVKDQRIAAHNRMNDLMLDLIGAKQRLRPGPLTPDEQRRVFTALYDVDTFRSQRQIDGRRQRAGCGPPHRRPTLAEDAALLRDAVAWVRTCWRRQSAQGEHR